MINLAPRVYYFSNIIEERQKYQRYKQLSVTQKYQFCFR